MTILISVLVFFVIFSVVILVHEAGHFLAARKSGMKVEEFGFGIPPRIVGKETSRWVVLPGKGGKKVRKKEKMTWSLNWIPFGGFVKVLGEDDDKAVRSDPRAFGARPIGKRILFVTGGVLMNFFLGWFLLTTAFSIGCEPFIFSAQDI